MGKAHWQPNFTAVPNVLLDRIMPHLDPAKSLILLAVARKTIGWHKAEADISIREIELMVPFNDRYVRKQLGELIEMGLILRQFNFDESGAPVPSTYGINKDWEIPGSWGMEPQDIGDEDVENPTPQGSEEPHPQGFCSAPHVKKEKNLSSTSERKKNERKLDTSHTRVRARASDGDGNRIAAATRTELERVWEELVTTYPARDGAREAARGREVFLKLAKTEPLQPILDGVRRYRDWCDKTGHTRTRFVKQIPTFLRGRGWEEPWEVMATPALVLPVGGYRRGERSETLQEKNERLKLEWDLKHGANNGHEPGGCSQGVFASYGGGVSQSEAYRQ